MGRKSGHNTPYIRKGGGKDFIYKWGPLQDLPKDINDRSAKRKKIKDSQKIVKCNATPGSQGYDNKVTYTYTPQVTSEGLQHGAYVECNYVE